MSFQTASQITSHLRKILHNNKRDNREQEPPVKQARQTGLGESETPQTPSPSNTIQDYDDDGDGEFADIEDNSNEEADTSEALPHPIYSRGRMVYEDDLYQVFVKAVRHKKPTQYSLSDHLFTVWVKSKTLVNNEEPLLFDLELALEKALIEILDRLKAVYDSQQNQNQIYITVLEKSMLNGLNSGNYSLHTPSKTIVRWVLSMLYHFLKSNQTIRLNESFKIQIKVLSLRHTQALEKNKRGFTRHLYH